MTVCVYMLTVSVSILGEYMSLCAYMTIVVTITCTLYKSILCLMNNMTFQFHCVFLSYLKPYLTYLIP